MRNKLILFAGIVMLVAGIVLKPETNSPAWPYMLMTLGVGLKIYYVLLKILRGEYKPGYETLFLLAGLTLFFSGIYLRSVSYTVLPPSWFMVSGIALKTTFIVAFILKTKQQKKHV